MPKTKQTDLINALTTVLADTYVLAVKNHGYHWNVTGMMFAPLHEFFGKQYESLFEAADDLAERIRALGAPAPASMAQLLQAATLKEAGTKPLSDRAMLEDLIAAHEGMAATLHAAKRHALAVDDTATDDMLIGRLQDHEKTLWMLRSMLG